MRRKVTNTLSTTMQRGLHGYLAALLGVALASLVIAVIQTRVHFGNISLVYLLVVLWLAAVYGRGPAVLASVLAFLAYDFFFIPPLYVFTVDDPAEWISLCALLATSLVLGQLTAAVQARAREAVASRQEATASQQRTATLYALAQLIVSSNDVDMLLRACTERVTQVFGPAGIMACTIILPDTQGWPVTRAIAPMQSSPAEALNLDVRERAAQAAWVLEHGSSVGSATRANTEAATEEHVTLFVPLRSGARVVGVLGVAGNPAIRRLIAGLPSHKAARSHFGTSVAQADQDPQIALFAAFCDQIALAVERITLQQQAIHAAALRESDRLKNALLGSVTHDLRTPLASIQAATSSLLDTDITWSETDRHEFLETIDISTERLNRLVSNLLDLSRLEAGTAMPEKQWSHIDDVIATVLDRLDLAGRTQGREIAVDVPDELPLVPMDHAQIEQVLTNLLENALKYSPAESPIRVLVRILGAPPTELEVRVVDQGIGIPANELRAIFDKFYRVQHVYLPWASTRPPTGTGLGLAICAGIIREHGGRIWAESQPGKGATFIFTLPIPHDAPSSVELPDFPGVVLAAPGSASAAETEAESANPETLGARE